MNFSNKDTELAYQDVYARPFSMKTFLINNQQQIVRKTELDLGLLQLQDGALCDNSKRFPAVNYYHKELHL